MDDGFEHGYAERDGVRLHYAAAGRGRLILFLHGFPEFWYAWRRQLSEFGRDRRAVAPDQRGYNLSSKPKGIPAYAIGELVADVLALGAHFGETRFTLVGHDWGGIVAWAVALHHPEAVERLIVLNAPHPGIFERELRTNPAQQKASQYIGVFRAPLAEMMLSAFNFKALADSVLRDGLRAGYFTEADRAAYLASWAQPGALTAALNYYRAAPLGDLKRPAGSAGSVLAPGLASLVVRAPTLVIWGMQDPYLLPGNLEGLDAFVPQLKVLRVPEATHWVQHEQPELVNTAIREFLDEARPA